MADGADGTVTAGKAFDQTFAVGILGQIPKWAMTTGIEDGVETLIADLGQNAGFGQCFLGVFVGLEAIRRLGL